jgi:hypothetical protein
LNNFEFRYWTNISRPCTFMEKKLIRPDTHYQVDLNGTSDQVRLSGLPDSECARQD